MCVRTRFPLDSKSLGAYKYTYTVMNKVTSRSYPDLATWRAAKGYSQQQAAVLLGISQTFYSRLERRVLSAPGKRAKRIMEQTGVPLEILVGAA